MRPVPLQPAEQLLQLLESLPSHSLDTSATAEEAAAGGAGSSPETACDGASEPTAAAADTVTPLTGGTGVLLPPTMNVGEQLLASSIVAMWRGRCVVEEWRLGEGPQVATVGTALDTTLFLVLFPW